MGDVVEQGTRAVAVAGVIWNRNGEHASLCVYGDRRNHSGTHAGPFAITYVNPADDRARRACISCRLREVRQAFARSPDEQGDCRAHNLQSSGSSCGRLRGVSRRIYVSMQHLRHLCYIRKGSGESFRTFLKDASAVARVASNILRRAPSWRTDNCRTIHDSRNWYPYVYYDFNCRDREKNVAAIRGTIPNDRSAATGRRGCGKARRDVREHRVSEGNA